jgi:hypothetical protein
MSMLRTGNAGHARLYDACFFMGDLAERGAQELLMIPRYRRDHRDSGHHHIGGIQPAAEPDLQ